MEVQTLMQQTGRHQDSLDVWVLDELMEMDLSSITSGCSGTTRDETMTASMGR